MGELGMLMTALGQTETLEAEFLEPGRFTARARRFDLRPGVALVLRTGFFYSKEADRLRARECLRKKKTLLLVASSRGISSSQLQIVARDSKRWRAMASDGLRHLTFLFELYKDQINGKRFCVNTPHKRREMPGVAKVMGDPCTFGFWCTDENGPALVRKSTGWTNSSKIAKTLDRMCS